MGNLVVTETRTRTIVRAVSYRIVAVWLTALIVGVEKAIHIHILLTAVHYVIERLWLKVKWGTHLEIRD